MAERCKTLFLVREVSFENVGNLVLEKDQRRTFEESVLVGLVVVVYLDQLHGGPVVHVVVDGFL